MNLGLTPLDTRNLRTDAARVFDLSVASADPVEAGDPVDAPHRPGGLRW